MFLKQTYCVQAGIETCNRKYETYTYAFKRSIISLVFLLSLSPILLQAQTTTKYYEIKVAGIKVGDFWAKEIKKANGIVSYEVNSKVDINLLVYKMKTLFVSKLEYVNGNLQSGRVDMKTNKGDFFSQTTRNKNGYVVKGQHQEGFFERIFTEPIRMSMVQLYFAEPINESKVFAEFYGDFMKLKKLEKGVYLGVLNDNQDHFYYQNGNLIKTVKENGVKDLEFIYINTTVKPNL